MGGPEGFRVDETFTAELGRTSGAGFADLDGDGDPDLVVVRNVRSTPTGRAPTTVYRNDDGRLVSAGTLPEPAGGRSVGLLDYDADGRLDLFIAEDRFAGGSSVLLRNTGDLAFVDATETAGLPPGIVGMGVGTADLDGDGDPDLLVSGSNRLFLNQGGGRFTESTGAIPPWTTYGTEDDPAGVAQGDVNGDGRIDVVIGQHFNSTLDGAKRVPVRLYLNEADERGGVRLRDVTDAAGLTGLATKSPHVDIADLDADGRPDIVTTAAGDDGALPIVFRNVGTEAGVPRFEATAASGRASTGSPAPRSTPTTTVGSMSCSPSGSRRSPRGSSAPPATPVTGSPSPASRGRRSRCSPPDPSATPARGAATAVIGTATGYSAGPTDATWIGLGDQDRVDLRITAPDGGSTGSGTSASTVASPAAGDASSTRCGARPNRVRPPAGEGGTVLDTRIEGAHVVDGTGAPSRTADVGIRDGPDRRPRPGRRAGPRDHRRRRAGRLPGLRRPAHPLRRPAVLGPAASPSNVHGVTSVIGGNCSFAPRPTARGRRRLHAPDDGPGRGHAPGRARRRGCRGPGSRSATTSTRSTDASRSTPGSSPATRRCAATCSVRTPTSPPPVPTGSRGWRRCSPTRSRPVRSGLSTDISTAHMDGDGNPIPATRRHLRRAPRAVRSGRSVPGHHPGRDLRRRQHRVDRRRARPPHAHVGRRQPGPQLEPARPRRGVPGAGRAAARALDARSGPRRTDRRARSCRPWSR